jgi:diguanylate cyclase (GGDEF)-like protein
VSESPFPTSSQDDPTCAAPAPEQHDVCQPRIRRRLLAVRRPGGDECTVGVAAGRLGIRVVDAPDEQAAADYLERNVAACVVIDATDPQIDVLGAVTHLTTVRDEVPVVVIGDEQDPLGAVAVVQAGAQDYLYAGDTDGVALERAIRHSIDRHRTRTQLRHLALHDQLTGAANRALFADRLDLALKRREREGGDIAVLFIDIDGFKRINDHLGHSAGDRALRAAAGRMQSAIRPADTLARLGGDEFTVLCDGLPDVATPMAIAERIAAVLGEPLAIGDTEVVLRTSVGVTVTGYGQRHTAERLVHEADQAMHAAKQRGGGRIELFDAESQRRNGNGLILETDLRHSIPGDLRAVYQPQVRLCDGSIAGVEALVRWDHPDRGVVSPGEFIPIAEESGLILPIGRWMLTEACAEAARLGELDGRHSRMSVNVSARQFADPALVSDVEYALSESGLPPERLQLELTESILIHDLSAGVEVVERLKELGVSIALDDFGKGYSSLSYLKALPIDVIKIDRSFVKGLPDCREDLAIVSAVVSFAGALGMDVLAEGVETEAHRESLLELGCDHAQGFLFYRPLDLADLRAVWRG